MVNKTYILSGLALLALLNNNKNKAQVSRSEKNDQNEDRISRIERELELIDTINKKVDFNYFLFSEKFDQVNNTLNKLEQDINKLKEDNSKNKAQISSNKVRISRIERELYSTISKVDVNFSNLEDLNNIVYDKFEQVNNTLNQLKEDIIN